MQSSHPFSLTLPLKDNIDLAASLVASGKTADSTGAVKLIGGTWSAFPATIRTSRPATRSH